MQSDVLESIPTKEIGLICLGAAAVYLFLAIASYSPTDPAWSFVGRGIDVHNLVGRSGAWTADVVLFAVGWLAYAVPVALLFMGVRLVLDRDPIAWRAFAMRGIGWLIVVLAGSVLARLHIAEAASLPAGAGGAIGDWLTRVSFSSLSWVGLTLVATTALAIGLQAAIGFSWLDVCERTGRGVMRASAWSLDRLVAGRARAAIWFEARRMRVEARREAREAAAQSAVQRVPAVIDARARAAAGTNTAPPTPPALALVDSSPSGAPAMRSTLTVATPARPVEIAPEVRQKRLFDSGAPNEMPGLDLLDEEDGAEDRGFSADSLGTMSRLLEVKLADFGVEAEVVSVLPGPVITRFEIQPAAGVKVSRISALAKDLARSLAVISVRIVEVIPGKPVVGIEIPNNDRETVRLKELLSSEIYQQAASPLTLSLGKDISGQPVIADIGKMPHLLVAGTTGSGKSVGVNAMLLSMLYKATPEELRLILVDPKMLELAVYDGIPHLLTPVVTDMRDASQALRWCVGEMERRYRLMAALGVRNLAGYNKRVTEADKAGTPIPDPIAEASGEPTQALVRLPLIVVVIDEFADMMMIVGKKVEQLIARIAQKARAAGIHLVLATQRPSVDVITGLIKANIPARISFQVSSKVDSRTILDQGGAEQLLGHGDMLYLPPGTSLPTRVHGAFVSDEEVHSVVSDWRSRAAPDYNEDVLAGDVDSSDPAVMALADDAENSEPLYDEAVAFVIETRRASISAVQRKMRIGYNRAARLIETMEAAGVVSEMGTNGAREVLVPKA